MKENIKAEVVEQLRKDISFGFYDSNELFENIVDMFYDIENFDKNWLKDEIESRLAKHEDQSQYWEKPTDFERLKDAFDQLNEKGIVSLHKAGYTRQDAENDCLEMIDELKAIGINAKGYCYYHTQDLERVLGEEKMLFLGYDSYNGEDELAKQVAQEIVDILKHNGFNVKWNGSLNSRIEVLDINWRKTIDGIDYNYDRIFKIMRNNPEIKDKNGKKDPKPFWKFW
ncbi:hypothetical protein [Winogradskyella sp.]|uniref:DUF6891 domain-containing protein n=1 Tax=Winogradskyella sp. TaxID=1883156 RepID=UPI00260C4049|nr:hypothetical protein [Winogradskyella sp.]